MVPMWIVALVALLLAIVAVVSVIAVVHGERNHRLIAKEEGLEPPPADFTDIDFDDDDESLSPVPERASVEEHDLVAQEFTETITKTVEVIEMVATPLDEAGAPSGDPVVVVEPEVVPEAEPEPRRHEVIIPKEMEYLTEPDDALDGLDAALLEHMTKAVPDEGPVEEIVLTVVGPGDETREHPEDPEVVVPVADPIRRLQEEAAGKAPTEWKRWNKP